MCIIIVKKSGIKLPSKTMLKRCEKQNNDGMGIMWVREGEKLTHIKKDFQNLKHMINFINKNIMQSDTLCIHFRYATSGIVNRTQRHPFVITTDPQSVLRMRGDCKKAVMHNGVLSEYDFQNQMSDTINFTTTVLANKIVKNNLHDPVIQYFIKEVLQGDRLAISNNGKLILLGEWVTQKTTGLVFSNEGYRPTPKCNDKWVTMDDALLLDNLENEIKEDDQQFSECDLCGKWKQVTTLEAYEASLHVCKQCKKSYQDGTLTM